MKSDGSAKGNVKHLWSLAYRNISDSASLEIQYLVYLYIVIIWLRLESKILEFSRI